jgi:hypothetical protein
MAKKSRRERVVNLPPEAYNAPAYAPSNATAAQNDAKRAEAVSFDLQTEYKDVLGDLRRTFVIFIGMAVAMIALSFVIR